MAKRRPRTGEPREVNQPLKIDRLPPSVHEAILKLRNRDGKTWQEIEVLSAEPYGEGKLGFVDWVILPTPVLELFPDMRIPKSNLHRWFDIRVDQVREETMRRSEVARTVAAAFAGAEVAGDKDASIHAMRDVIFGMMSEAQDSATQEFLAKALSKLAEVQQKARLNDIRQEKVSVEARKMRLMEKREKLAIQKLEQETDRLAKKARTGQPITVEELQNVRMKAFGF
jgi:hypothetical protein